MSKLDDRLEDRIALFPSTRLKVQDLLVLDYEKTFRDRGSGFVMDIEIEHLIAPFILIVIPTWYNTHQALKKGRNFFISLILSFVFICSAWIGFGAWGFSLMWVYELIDGLKITWWIGTPLYFVLGGISCFLSIMFVAFFAALWDNYNDKGIIKIGIKKPKFINKLLNNKN